MEVFWTLVCVAICLGGSCDASINVTTVGNDTYESPVVQISDGTIKGTINQTVGENNTYYAFRGIPYAQVPVGDLRFAAPEKNSNWTGTLNATADPSQCVQGSVATGSEDCLYINVYVPKVNATNLPVMVWIYGGGFLEGNSSYALYGPDYLLDQQVIYVAFNYRVGIFGFLSTEDSACYGNWGLKDQILALTWVQNNIANFTGDPNNVTIFGESAGSASVSLLVQTNLTKGLFKGAIMESGTSLNLWARNVKARRTAFEIGVALGIVTISSTTLITRLRTIAANTLQTTAYDISDEIMLEDALEGLAFAPVIEVAHDGAVLQNASFNLLKSGAAQNVCQIIGYNSNEAAAVGSISAILTAYLLYYDVAITDLCPNNLTTSSIEELSVGILVDYYYFGILPLAAQDDAVIEFVSEDQFNRPIRMAGNQTSRYNPNVYAYLFSHEGLLSGITDRNFTGVGHAEDVYYIFRSPYNYTDADILTRTRIVKLWTNFAKFCNPTPYEDSLFHNLTWPALNVTTGNYTVLNINTTLSVDQNPNQDGWDFYQGIWDEHGDPPYDTY